MMKRDLEGIKGRLLGERERVVESLRRNTEHTLSKIDDTTRDACDLASASHDRGVLYQLQESDANRLKLINEVLSRIDWHGYRICEYCGQEFGKARLEAIPWAMNCLTCQEETDLGEPLFRDSTVKSDRTEGILRSVVEPLRLWKHRSVAKMSGGLIEVGLWKRSRMS